MGNAIFTRAYLKRKMCAKKGQVIATELQAEKNGCKNLNFLNLALITPTEYPAEVASCWLFKT